MNRILFAGTPDICVPLLEKLASEFDVAGVLTNCDKPQGRSKQPVASPAKETAVRLGIPVIQFDSLKSEARQAVKALGADTLVTFAFGKIFGPKFLALFPNGTFNVHPSHLPCFRGPSPVQATILSGLKRATISIQKIGLGMDEGDIFATTDFVLDGTETTQQLEKAISLKAADFVPGVLKKAFSGELEAKPQEGEASYCRMLDKSSALIDFTRTASEVHSFIRAMYPWPKAYAILGNQIVFITGVWGGFSDVANQSPLCNVKPGTVLEMRKDRGIAIACSDKAVWVTSLQLPGKKELDFRSFANGNSRFLSSVLNDTSV